LHGDTASAADLPPVPAVPLALQLPSLYAQVVQALATRDVNCSPSRQTVLGYPIVPRARASDAKPKSTASLYDRVRQVVLQNKTEETQRLGMGDFAFQDVPDDGSIMVGMEVSYATFFTHQVIKCVHPR